MADSKANPKRGKSSAADPGWEHGTGIDKDKKKVRCNYCQVVRWGGVYRLKHHLAGTRDNVEPCPQVPEEVRQQFLDLLTKQQSSKKRKTCYDSDNEDDIIIEEVRDHKGKGIMDMKGFHTKSKQSTMNQMFKKEKREEVCQQIARFFYTSAVPFNCANNPEFVRMVDMIGRYGVGLKPPSYHEIRVTYLQKEVARTLQILEEYKEEWKKTGCSIMSDGWSDRKKRSICNFLVNSPKGSVFLCSIDTSEISKTAEKVLEMIDQVVEKVGEENVVQVVTDNASNYKLAGELLMGKRKTLYWTPCAAHCIDLMLEDFEKKLPLHRQTIAMGRKITTFIYGRTLLLTWLRQFTKGRDLIRPAITRFATAYLTLACLNEQKGALMTMFTSKKWESSRFVKLKEGKNIQGIVLDNRGFWQDVVTCLKGAMPLVKVLRMVDSDMSPQMGFIYEQMNRARAKITENFKSVDKSKPLLDIIDQRWQLQLHRPLHAAAYYLNPHYHYSPEFKPTVEIKKGLYSCIERMVDDSNERVFIDMQIDKFKRAEGLFGLESAILTRKKKSPADWWDSYGDECPELKRFAIRVLSLTCSSSGCERNWSAFEMVHSKRRNRLHQKKMNDLVFVMYNLKLKQRQLRRNKAKSDDEQFSLSFDDLSSDDEWITEQEDPVFPQTGNWLDVLDRAAQKEARNETLSSEIDHEDIQASPCDDIFEKQKDFEINENDDDFFMVDVRRNNDVDHELGAGDSNANEGRAFLSDDENNCFDH